MDALLKVKNVIKRFAATTALKDVSLNIAPGSVTSVLGENGAGKSTLMKILCGAYPHTSYDGDFFLSEKVCRFKNPMDAGKNGIAMIHQEINIEADLSITENILLGKLETKAPGLIDWKKSHRTARKYLEQLKIDLDVRLPARMLSASYQQLVCIARALADSPRILILDEPTASLTESESKHLFQVIENLKTRGITCIYISHKLEEVLQISDTIIILRDGKYISEYPRTSFDKKVIIRDIVGKSIDTDRASFISPEKTVAFSVRDVTIPNLFIPEKPLLSDISFDLHRGEVLGLAGLVGSGRSELLKSFIGAYPRHSGRIVINGEERPIRSPKESIAAGIGLLTEDRKRDGYVSTMDIAENISLPILKKISRARIIRRQKEESVVSRYIKALSVKTNSMRDSILSLSGGNQQKVLFSKWLATELKILFLDEPTRGVDIGAKYEIYNLIENLADKGVAVIIVSSELPELLSICHRFLVLNNGHITKTLPRENTTEADILHACSFEDSGS